MGHRSILCGIGALGGAFAVAGLVLAWRVSNSPGDDNPAGLFGIWIAGVGAIPSYALVLVVRRASIGDHLFWAAGAGLSLVTLALVAPILLTLLGVVR